MASLTPLSSIIEELRTELEQNGQDLDDIRDNSGEWIEGFMPIYYNRIIEEWTELPSDYTNRGAIELGQGGETNIYNLMGWDLYLYYSDLVEQALTELEEELADKEEQE